MSASGRLVLSSASRHYNRVFFRMATFRAACEAEDENLARIIHHAFRLAWFASTLSRNKLPELKVLQGGKLVVQSLLTPAETGSSCPS